jgi:hypothetical protein
VYRHAGMNLEAAGKVIFTASDHNREFFHTDPAAGMLAYNTCRAERTPLCVNSANVLISSSVKVTRYLAAIFTSNH